jgi:hypothetical protein
MKETALIAAVLLLAFSAWRLNDGMKRIAMSREISGAIQLLASDLTVMAPETEEEVMSMLQCKDDVTAASLRKTARYRIETGDTPEQAYLWTLRLYISAVEGRK